MACSECCARCALDRTEIDGLTRRVDEAMVRHRKHYADAHGGE